MLAKRLTRRGVVASGGLLGTVLTQQAASACVPMAVMSSTIKAATLVASGQAAAGAISPTVATLVSGVTKAMFMTKIKSVLTVVLVLGLTVGGVGVVLFNSAVAVAQQGTNKIAANEEAKKAEVGFARLGQKRDDIIAKYGKPTKTVTLASGIDSLEFRKGTLRLLVEISPRNDRAIQTYYCKKTPFTGIQIAELLKRNAEGQEWWAEEVTQEGFTYQRTDGGIARGGMRGEESMFAVLSGSEIQGRHPQADADREQAPKDDLKEIEGF